MAMIPSEIVDRAVEISAEFDATHSINISNDSSLPLSDLVRFKDLVKQTDSKSTQRIHQSIQ
jgi:hypothetical protein